MDGTVGSRRSSFTDIFLNNTWKFPNNSAIFFHILHWKVCNALLNLLLPKETSREIFCVLNWCWGPLASVDVVRLISREWCRDWLASKGCGRAILWSRCAQLLGSNWYRQNVSFKANEDLFYSLLHFIWRWRNKHKEPVAEEIVSKEGNNAVLEER